LKLYYHAYTRHKLLFTIKQLHESHNKTHNIAENCVADKEEQLLIWNIIFCYPDSWLKIFLCGAILGKLNAKIKADLQSVCLEK